MRPRGIRARATLLATGVVSYLLKPTYRAHATILITSQQIPEEFVRSTVREDTISNINAMIGEVLSRENLSRLVEDMGLVPSDAPGGFGARFAISRVCAGAMSTFATSPRFTAWSKQISAAAQFSNWYSTMTGAFRCRWSTISGATIHSSMPGLSVKWKT